MLHYHLFLAWIFIGSALAFDIFDMFRGGSGGRQHHRHREENTDGGRCPGFLCNFDFRVGPCVKSPEDCPCRDPQYKCIHGPNGAYTCVKDADYCNKLIAKVAL